MAERTHYHVLDVSPSATREEAREQYRRLVRLLHPDRLTDASEAEKRLAERRMRELTEAWKVIGDEEARRRYDDSLQRAEELRKARARRPAPAGAGARPAAPRPAPPGSAGGGSTTYAATTQLVNDTEDYGGLRFDPAPEDDRGHPMFFLRRGPVILMLAVLLGILVGSAYAARRDDSSPNGREPECIPTAAGRCQGR